MSSPIYHARHSQRALRACAPRTRYRRPCRHLRISKARARRRSAGPCFRLRRLWDRAGCAALALASATILVRKGTTLANLSGIVKQLKKERDRVQQQLSGLNAALEAFAGVYRGQNGTNPRRKMSAKGRARIAAAQRARWAKVKREQKRPKPGKRKMSASARRKIAAAPRKRWAKLKRNTENDRATRL